MVGEIHYESYSYDQTQTAIDLGHMDTLGSAVNDLADMMRNSWNTDQLAVQAAAQSVMDELDVAVAHERHGSSWSGSHGLAIYFPATQGQFDTDYNGTIIDFPADTLWEEFPADFYTAVGGSWVETARLASQAYYNDEHIDLYDFCAHIVLIVGEPPIADAGPDQTVNEGDTVTLEGSNSTDPDDDIATYLWQQTGGISITLSDATAVQPTFTAPDVESNGASLTFQLTVTDTIGLQSTDTCIVNVTSGSGGGDGVCFIAAAACGSAMEPYVKILREYRERFLGVIEGYL